MVSIHVLISATCGEFKQYVCICMYVYVCICMYMYMYMYMYICLFVCSILLSYIHLGTNKLPLKSLDKTHHQVDNLLLQLEKQFERLKRRIKRHGIYYLQKFTKRDVANYIGKSNNWFFDLFK